MAAIARLAPGGGIQFRIPPGRFSRTRQRQFIIAIQRGMLAAAEKAIPVIQSFTPVFRGNLKNSYQVRFQGRPTRVRIVSPLAYANVMELGRRPGSRRPPPGPIRAWVRQKLRVAANRVNAVAFLVARKIGERGIKIKGAGGLIARTGKGAMFERALKKLGSRHFKNEIAAAVRAAGF